MGHWRRTTASLRAALAALDALEGVSVVRVSRFFETSPVGTLDQKDFINAAAEIETELEPLELLPALKTIESDLGRRPGEHWGPRPIDLDIILWGDVVLNAPTLTLPHKEFRSRAFVLAPLAEIAPEAVDPVTGKAIAELRRSPAATGRVACIG